MDWRGITFDWNQARAFLVTAEEGSLSAAARALGLTQPTLGRQVSALEDRLGVTLFERAGRDGLALDEHVVPELALSSHHRAAANQNGHLSLRINRGLLRQNRRIDKREGASGRSRRAHSVNVPIE